MKRFRNASALAYVLGAPRSARSSPVRRVGRVDLARRARAGRRVRQAQRRRADRRLGRGVPPEQPAVSWSIEGPKGDRARSARGSARPARGAPSGSQADLGPPATRPEGRPRCAGPRATGAQDGRRPDGARWAARPPGPGGPRAAATLTSSNGLYSIEITNRGVYIRGPGGTVFVDHRGATPPPTATTAGDRNGRNHDHTHEHDAGEPAQEDRARGGRRARRRGGGARPGHRPRRGAVPVDDGTRS